MTRYELLDRIGVGGMAEIFRAKAVAAGGFEKPVAIKRILPHLSQDRRFVQLLIAEAKVLSQLRHRNIVQIFDVGLGDDGQYFLVMEFVDGTDLGAVQKTLEPRRRRLPLDLVLHIGAEVCEALEHAHKSRGPDGQPMRLVHRDVSPSNVLLSRAGEVKLTDFGIAKRAEEHTGHGAVRGKFAYISPEQARNEPVDARSDVFSVGVLLYEFCLGKRLYSGLPDLEALRAVREARVPPPSEVDATLSPEIEKLLLAALSRDPAQRPASAGALGAQLRSIRYSLDEPAGDPATELGKIVENVGQHAEPIPAPPAAKAPPLAGKKKNPFESIEPTALRIRTADEFQDSDGEGTSVIKARELLARFEEEETRMSSIGDAARGRRAPDTGEHTKAATPQAIFESGDHDEATEFSDERRLRDDADLEQETVDETEERTRFARPGAGELSPRPGGGNGGAGGAKGKQRRGKPTTKPPPVPAQARAAELDDARGGGRAGGRGADADDARGGRRGGAGDPARRGGFDPSNEPTTLGEQAWSPSHAPPLPPGRPAGGTRPPPVGGLPGLPGLGPPSMPASAAPVAAAGPAVPAGPPVANPGGAFGGFGPPNPNPAYGPGPAGPPALANPPPGAAFDAMGRPIGPAGGVIATVRPTRSDTPTAHDRYDATANRLPPPRGGPFVEGFARSDDARRTMLLIVGAIITGILGFAITRAIIGSDDKTATPATKIDAAPASHDAATGSATGATTGSATTGSATTGSATGAAAGTTTGSASTTATTPGLPPVGTGSATGSATATGSGSATATGSGSSSMTVTPVVIKNPGTGSGSGSGSAAGSGSGATTKTTTTKTTKKSTKKKSTKRKHR